MSPDTKEEVERRFKRVFHREMTLEERRCFFLVDERQVIASDMGTSDQEKPRGWPKDS
jgi:hypothetical protein